MYDITLKLTRYFRQTITFLALNW